jgi:hypothetical protein
MSFTLAAEDRFCTCGVMLATIASSAGYTAPSFPLLVVISVYIDYGAVSIHRSMAH